MKTKLSKIAQDLEKGTITENEARTHILATICYAFGFIYKLKKTIK